jgi:hypothetical protein
MSGMNDRSHQVPGERPPATPASGAPGDRNAADKQAPPAPPPREIGGPKGPEPTRYGDWEYGGRCTDF